MRKKMTGNPGTLYFDLSDQDDRKITTFLMNIPFTPVPEPSTHALFTFTPCALGIRARASYSKY